MSNNTQKSYTAEITIQFTEIGEANNLDHAKEIVKENFRDSFNLELQDDEMVIEMESEVSQ